MVTKVEEEQVKEYLQRAEVRTMKKDLFKLREVDAVKERDKIANLKTVEEQVLAPMRRVDEGVKKVFQANLQKEHEAEKDLKKYATEAEKQQIFLLESDRVQAEDELKEIESKKEPEILLKKNEFIYQQKDVEDKLGQIKQEEAKQESEQKFIEEKESQSQIPAEKKGFEERRSEIEIERQETEKRRWAVEREIQDILEKIKDADYDLQILSTQKNKLNEKIKTIDESLRTVYSAIIAREEERRAGQEAEQKIRREELAKASAQRKEEIQREQWTGVPTPPMKKYKTNIQI